VHDVAHGPGEYVLGDQDGVAPRGERDRMSGMLAAGEEVPDDRDVAVASSGLVRREVQLGVLLVAARQE